MFWSFVWPARHWHLKTQRYYLHRGARSAFIKYVLSPRWILPSGHLYQNYCSCLYNSLIFLKVSSLFYALKFLNHETSSSTLKLMVLSLCWRLYALEKRRFSYLKSLCFVYCQLKPIQPPNKISDFRWLLEDQRLMTFSGTDNLARSVRYCFRSYFNTYIHAVRVLQVKVSDQLFAVSASE